MQVFLNSGTFRQANFNGTKLRRIYCNETLVWRSVPEYLYQAGNEATDVTGGWEIANVWGDRGNSLYPSCGFAKKKAHGIHLFGAASGPGATGNDNVLGVGYIYTREVVDLTDLRTITMALTGEMVMGRVILCVTDAPKLVVGQTEPRTLAKVEENGIRTLDGTIMLDVSGITGSHLVWVGATSGRASAGSTPEGWHADVTVTRIGCD